MDEDVSDAAEAATPARSPKPRKPKAKANGKLAKAKPVKKAVAKKAKASVRAFVKAKAKVTKSKAEKDQFGLRKGSQKSDAAALYSRKNGATLEEVKEKVGSIQLNVLKELSAEGYKVIQEKQERKGKRPVTRYYLHAKR